MKKILFLLFLSPLCITAQDAFSIDTEDAYMPKYKILPNDSIIGQIETGSTFHIACVKRSYPNAYFFIFREIDVRDTIQLNGFYFKSDDQLMKLQRTIANNLHHKKKKNLDTTLPYGDMVLLTFRKQRVQILLWNGYQFKFTMFFTKEQIAQLFGDFWKEIPIQ